MARPGTARCFFAAVGATVGCFVAIQVMSSRAGDQGILAAEAQAPKLAPLGFASDYVVIDVSKFRWLWWPAILYLFWGMAFVCDEYFVRTIEVISERFSIPDDVAGATLLALGCNGPEMSLNMISIFHPSPIGVGAVVGGEVFNVLVIIGTAVLATPEMYLPVKLVKFCFFRDVVFYMVSVAMLYWALRDGSVSRVHALCLLGGAVCYTVTVVFSTQVNDFFNREARLVKSMTKRITRTTFKSAKVNDALLQKEDDDGDSDAESEVSPETIEIWQDAVTCCEPERGSVLGVRVDVRNRLMDRNRRYATRYMWLSDDALVVSTLVDPVGDAKVLARASTSVVFDHDAKTQDHHWHHGGLVNQPKFLRKNEIQAAEAPPPIDQPGFNEAPWEIIPLEDVLYCERAGDDQKHFNLHVHQNDSQLGKLITLELFAEDPVVMDAWVNAIRHRLLEQRRKTTEAPPAKGLVASAMEWVHWLQFPVEFFVSRTIPDMNDPKKHHLYSVAFLMSMVWLAIFAFSVVKACDGIHEDFGISEDILGFTLAAAGTSFPNVFSGMCVAKQGKTSMAVANALGANVQNVFLALAVPWTLQSFFINHGPIPMPVENLLPAVLECVITLMPVVLIYIFCGFSMPRWSGALYLLIYLAYVIVAIGA